MPLKTAQRYWNYKAQNGTAILTARQIRRLNKKSRHWSKRDQSVYVTD